MTRNEYQIVFRDREPRYRPRFTLWQGALIGIVGGLVASIVLVASRYLLG